MTTQNDNKNDAKEPWFEIGNQALDLTPQDYAKLFPLEPSKNRKSKWKSRKNKPTTTFTPNIEKVFKSDEICKFFAEKNCLEEKNDEDQNEELESDSEPELTSPESAKTDPTTPKKSIQKSIPTPKPYKTNLLALKFSKRYRHPNEDFQNHSVYGEIPLVDPTTILAQLYSLSLESKKFENTLKIDVKQKILEEKNTILNNIETNPDNVNLPAAGRKAKINLEKYEQVCQWMEMGDRIIVGGVLGCVDEVVEKEYLVKTE